MPSKPPTTQKLDASSSPQIPVCRKNSIMKAFRLRAIRDRSATPLGDLRPKVIRSKPVVPSVTESRNDQGLTPSFSEMFIAKIKAELFLSQFKRAQEAYLDHDLDLCIQRCTELLESASLHLDTRVETLQLLAIITPLDTARKHASTALHLLGLAASRGGNTAHMEVLLGLRITTLDILAKLERNLTRSEQSPENEDGGAGHGVHAGSREGKSVESGLRGIYKPLVSLLSLSRPLRE